ncbi:TIGR02281 family clan AA aspartic protease [Tabrizicola sp. J26]|uniref:retropepsin-like aspartic protease family protein n=1 Tax=Alitabrizicola rongguiensis TaxID=2909234 RepID=UPI001F279490|nr:TIGR02281 family clan AA aspartic protease [Tabrizicola rongguiensis]MCF1709960.1 TIGR02281 family clan AA aspartic protease [Tabrizicola rongguiensis]
MDTNDLMRLMYLAVLLAAVGGWVLVEYRGRLGAALRNFMAWGLIFVGVAAGYGLWADMRRDLPYQAVVQDGRVEVTRAPDGHFYLPVEVNGQSIEFLVDTGASNIVLSQKDARRVGIDPSSLAYVGQAQTANGAVSTARVRLDSLTLGPWTDRDQAAWVNRGEMDGSLLGMDYLHGFKMEIDGQKMVLSR